MAKAAVSILRERRGHVELEWEIKNFFDLTHRVGEKVISPEYFWGDVSWFLRIYPDGYSEDSRGWISLFLQRNSDTGEHTVSHYYAIKVAGSVIEEVTGDSTFKEKSKGFGFSKFVHRSDISSFVKGDASWDGSVTFLFSGHLLGGRQHDVASQTSLFEGVENLSNNWKELFLEGRQTDVKLKVQGREFQAHKLVLGARSPVFNAMFESEMSEKKCGVVEISDLSSESFQDFLLFMYTGKFDLLRQENALEFYKAADKYDLNDIKVECSSRMSSWLTVANILAVILLAATHEETDLLKCATEYFIENAFEILSTESWLTFMVEQASIANDLLIQMAKQTLDTQIKNEQIVKKADVEV